MPPQFTVLTTFFQSERQDTTNGVLHRIDDLSTLRVQLYLPNRTLQGWLSPNLVDSISGKATTKKFQMQ